MGIRVLLVSGFSAGHMTVNDIERLKFAMSSVAVPILQLLNDAGKVCVKLGSRICF